MSIGSVDPLNQPSAHPSTDNTQEKKCISGPMGHGYPEVIEKTSLREKLPMNQSDSRANIEFDPVNFTDEWQTDLPNQNSENNP